MMTTGNGSPSIIHHGRTRGLRLGGKSMKKKSKVPGISSGDRFKNLVGQLSRRPGTGDPKKLAAFKHKSK